MNHVAMRVAVAVVGVATLSVAWGSLATASAERSDDVSDPMQVDGSRDNEDLLVDNFQSGAIVDSSNGDPTAPPNMSLTVASVGFVDEALLVG